jgi:signal transduction histidine kinase
LPCGPSVSSPPTAVDGLASAILDTTDATDASSGLIGQLMSAATTIVLIGTDQGGRVTYCSSGAEQMLDTAHHDFVGRWLPAAAFGTGELSARIAAFPRPAHSENLGVEISHQDRRAERQVDLGPLDRRTHARPPQSQVAEDCGRPRDWIVTLPGGGRLIAEMTVTQVTDALGDDAGYLFVGGEVTEERRSRHLLVSRLAKEAEAVERLRQLDQIKDDLVANVSHELRTPLTSILGYVELLKDGAAGPLTKRQRHLADAVDRNGDRLLALVNDLLTVSTIEAGGLQHDSSPLDLRDIVSSARRTMRPLFEGRGLTIRFHLPSTQIVVRGDAAHLERVVCNLLSNAVKFTPDGGTVECRVDSDGVRARIVVSDDGIGIPEDEQPNLFTRFFRSTIATDHAIQGTGLGLSIASSIVRGHRGDISVVSSPGEGTRVIVNLPLSES